MEYLYFDRDTYIKQMTIFYQEMSTITLDRIDVLRDGGRVKRMTISHRTEWSNDQLFHSTKKLFASGVSYVVR